MLILKTLLFASADNRELFSEINILESSEQLALIPNENKFGTSLITITVKDDGGVQNGGIDSTSVFNATVNPVNDPPSCLEQLENIY